MEKPEDVVNAVRMLYYSIGLSLLSTVITSSQLSSIFNITNTSFYIRLLICGCIGYGIMWFFIHKIDRGRNWARIILLILAVLSCIGTVVQFFAPMPLFHVFFEKFPIASLLSAGAFILYLIALILLFCTPSSEWFNYLKETRLAEIEHARRVQELVRQAQEFNEKKRSGTKTCPFCAETIKSAAIVCKHCGRDLPEQRDY